MSKTSISFILNKKNTRIEKVRKFCKMFAEDNNIVEKLSSKFFKCLEPVLMQGKSRRLNRRAEDRLIEALHDFREMPKDKFKLYDIKDAIEKYGKKCNYGQFENILISYSIGAFLHKNYNKCGHKKHAEILKDLGLTISIPHIFRCLKMYEFINKYPFLAPLLYHKYISKSDIYLIYDETIDYAKSKLSDELFDKINGYTI